MTNNIKSLYIHIPFCEHICSYCDFFKIVNSKEHEKYIQYLIKEIELKKNFLKDIETIYIGGGTPTCLSIELLKKLIDNLTKYISIDKIKEWTIEINPIHVNQDLISFLKQTPINRLSIGIQSYYDDILSIMKRKHNKTKAINCLKDLYNNGFTNISIDLIYGFLNDSKKRIKKEIKLSKKLHVKHISLYSLQLEEGT